jgi:hypothetical protein
VVKAHPAVQLVELNRANRDQVTARLLTALGDPAR